MANTLTFASQTLTDANIFGGINFLADLNVGEEFSIGNTASASVSFTTDVQLPLYTKDATNGTFTWTQDSTSRGRFYITEVKKVADRYNVTAYDAMILLEKSISALSISYPLTVSAAASAIATFIGCTVSGTINNGSISITELDASLTIRQLLGYIAETSGCSVKIDGSDHLCFMYYASSGITITADNYKSLNVADYVCAAIDKVVIFDSAGAIQAQAGSGTNTLYIQGNPILFSATDTHAQTILSKVSGFSYAPLTCELFDEAGLEIGKTATFGTITTLVMHLESSENGAVASSVGSDSRAEYNKSIDEMINAAMNSIQVGGRNYAATNTDDFPIGTTSSATGVTATLTGNATFTLNGTATSTNFVFGTGAAKLFGGGVLTPGEYLVWASSPGVGIRVGKGSDATYLRQISCGTKDSPTSLTITEEDVYWFTPYVQSGDAFSNVEFKLMIEQGNKPTDWSLAPEDVESDISEAATTATNYITDIGNSGIKVHAEGDTVNYTQIDGDGMKIYKGGNSVASFGDEITLGRQTSGFGRLTVTSSSMRFLPEYGSSDFKYSRQNGIAVTQTFIGDGVTRRFDIFRYSTGSLTVTVNGTTTTAFSVLFSQEDSLGRLTFTNAPADGAVIVMTYTTSWDNPFYVFGINTITAPYGVAEGRGNSVDGIFGHAEGRETSAGGAYSHAQNHGTKATGDSQTAMGRYNVEDTDSDFALIIGNGNATTRSDALEVTWDGDILFADDTDISAALTTLGWLS